MRRRGTTRSARPARTVVAAAAVGWLAVLAGCSSATTPGGRTAAATAPGRSSPPELSRSELAAGADHACVVPGSGRPKVAWAQLRNPVLSYPDAAVKDQAIVWADGRWHLLFSYVTGSTPNPSGQRWDIATATSTDLRHWSAPSPWSEQPGGMASPDIVRDPAGTYVVTYDSPPGEQGATQAKLYYRTSTDLEHWSPPHPLALALHPQPAVRMIDGALAWTGHGLILGYKVGTTSQAQAFEIAWSPSGSIGGPWTVVGRPAISVYGDTFENYEFVMADGTWRLVATSNTLDQPWMFSLQGDPADATSWLDWVDGAQLQVPGAPWDTGNGVSSLGFEHANSAFLCDATASDGYFYLTYAGSSELTAFGGWGHAKIGIARSTDLVHWEVPG